MKRRKINIQQTFEAIRQLPLEVSLEQVEIWVRQETLPRHGLLKRVSWRFLKWFDN